MRLTSWIICIPLVLLAGCAVAPAPARTAHAGSTGPTWTETGYGETIDVASELALEKARDSVDDYLQKNHHDIGWQPTIERLRKEGVVKLDKPKQGAFAEREGYEVTAHVDLTNLGNLQIDVDQAREQAQENAVFWRHLLVGRILAALVALFLIVGGYLRLEELTRGYYTTLLRVGAGAVMLLIAAIVLFVRI
jgi:hypothetical protein